MKKPIRFPASLLLLSALGAAPGCVTETLPADVASDDRKEQLGILCEAHVQIAGQFQAGARKPSDVSGCWPVGTWTFTAAVESTDCQSPLVLEPQYSFSVTRDDDQVESYGFISPAARDGVKLKVSSGGGGLCEGGLMVYSPDRKTLVNLKPTLYSDGRIDGMGEIELYATAQF